MKASCLNCKYYTINDVRTGLCRVEALTSENRNAEKPEVKAAGNCKKWVDCGQTYYIRLGWLKNMTKEEEK